MNVEVVFLPDALKSRHLSGPVVVFDVLRATTSMVAALAAGVSEIRIFAETTEAVSAAARCTSPRLLCGEINCLPPAGFDLGNSPRAFQPEAHRGRTMFMCTTNGTRAIAAVREAPLILIGAIVNASAVARRCASENRDVTLLCAGTGGEVAMEDILGAGAVLEGMMQVSDDILLASDAARVALSLFRSARSNLIQVLRETTGGRNVIAAGLERDINYAALDVFDLAPVVRDHPLRATVD